MPIPDACQPIADEIAEKEQERDDYQEQLQFADTAEKDDLARAIKKLNREIADLNDDLADCLRDTPAPPEPPPPLEATFVGNATFTTSNPSAPGPFNPSVLLGLIFNGERTFIGITSFPTISTAPTPTPFGDNVTTISKSGGGTGNYANGEIAMPLILLFDQSVDFPGSQDSDFGLLLSTTAPGGSPVDSSGAVTLVGNGTFTRGFLDGDTGSLTITGTISPVP